MPDRWQAFLDYARFARAKPAFDADERERPLAVAAAAREALERARDGGAWRPAMREAFALCRFTDIPFAQGAPWFWPWAKADPESLRRALVELAGAPDPVVGVESLERAASRAENPAPALLAVGSFLNFALAPDALPFVRDRHFRRLEAILGHGEPPPGTVAGAYRHHLAFAAQVRHRLERAGIPIRDMLDVQALVFGAAQHTQFWIGDPRLEPEPWDRSRPYLSACAVYRDEAPYLREWIEFHRLVGVERFYLYDNLSRDGHRELFEPYVRAGIVVPHEIEAPGWQIQPVAYERCAAEHGDESRWIAFLDLDEFLFSPTYRPLPELLADLEAFPGIGVNWAMFGPSGRRARPSGTVIESYTNHLDLPQNRWFKTIANPRRLVAGTGGHFFRFDRSCTVDENGYPISRGFTKSVSQARLRINHYFTKSLEEYRAKLERSNVNPLRMRSDLETVDRWEREHGTPDDAILFYLPALREALAEEAPVT